MTSDLVVVFNARQMSDCELCECVLRYFYANGITERFEFDDAIVIYDRMIVIHITRSTNMCK